MCKPISILSGRTESISCIRWAERSLVLAKVVAFVDIVQQSDDFLLRDEWHAGHGLERIPVQRLAHALEFFFAAQA